jgi:hypothetical protein
MRNHLAHIGAAALISSLAIACSGRTSKSDNAWVDQGAGGRGQHERIKIEGCVQAAPGQNEFALKEVYVPPPAEQPVQQDTMEHPVPVSNGSWVRLTGGSQDLKDYLGQRVTIIGKVTESGANTLGTSGRTTPAKEAQDTHGKFAQSSKDANTNPDRAMPPSTVAPVGADANGNAPLIAVETIDKMNQACSTR